MKNVIIISLILSVLISCKEEHCECSITDKKIEKIDSQLDEIKISIGFHDAEQLLYRNEKIDKTYTLDIDNTLLNYCKTYKLVGHLEKPYLQILLAEKHIENKRIKRKIIKEKKIELSTFEWEEIDDLITHSCFWTKDLFIKEDSNKVENLFYTLEGIDMNSNICTKNIFHQIIRKSRTSNDIFILVDKLKKLEPLSDLDSLITIETNRVNIK